MKKALLFPLKIIQSILLLLWLVLAGTLSTLVALLSFTPVAGHWVVRNIYCRGFFVILGIIRESNHVRTFTVHGYQFAGIGHHLGILIPTILTISALAAIWAA